MTGFKWLSSLVLAFIAFAATLAPTLKAEIRCPGNVASLRFQLVNRSRIIIPVEINHTGPYNFLLDTGAQVTIVDPSLADVLHLQIEGNASLGGVGFRTQASLSTLDSLEVGSKSAWDQQAVVRDVSYLKAAGANVQGILGGNFLENFDVFIDYAHSMLCLDETGQMQPGVRGEQLALAKLPVTDCLMPYNMPPIIPVTILRAGTRPLLLKLDSGTNVPFLFDPDKYMDLGLSQGASMHGLSADGVQRRFSALPPQDLKIGRRTLSQVALVKLANQGKNLPKGEVDGLLPTNLFRSIYISYADHFVVLDPR